MAPAYDGTMSGVNQPVHPARPRQRYTEDGRRMREVLSYSRRGGRFTPSQQAAWDAHHRDWVIPDRAVDDPGFTWSEVFGREAPRIVEIGSGIGEATAALAAARPSYDVVALEVWRPGVAHSLGLLAEAGATNVRLLSVDAVWCLEHLFAPGEVAELWTFFPDPWPKTRHHKRRLVTPGFAELAASRLADGGWWRLATDWADYAEQVCEVLDAEPGFHGGVVPRWTDRPVTKFERKGVAAGRGIIDLAYRRQEPGRIGPHS
jgi:tRNA (guanine-N7-)-methyltransferase